MTRPRRRMRARSAVHSGVGAEAGGGLAQYSLSSAESTMKQLGGYGSIDPKPRTRGRHVITQSTRCEYSIDPKPRTRGQTAGAPGRVWFSAWLVDSPRVPPTAAHSVQRRR